ncbi:MAG: DoxX family membrane protein [Cyclobacteriaceae bacterium]|nr:DoxX family membrane protein [Cyclobacteriaceae bacterium]
MKKVFSSAPIMATHGLGIVRIIFGALMVYHGKEVFDPQLMKEYASWDSLSGANGLLWVYIGKGTELLAGLFLLLGLFTRLGSLLTIGTMSYITFFVGGGKFWYEDQHPFMFALFGLLFLFTGSGGFSLHAIIFEDRSGMKHV